ncbi:MAG: sigma-70 family RNA polymerase sigma factor [Clostridiales Family XIII bacterium]|jgi:RNA polymerase sigma-70 factor (ECF subfamily)|nr:sigma-70 family RNA polymerase sigma factor [Clostridiales Family XIII bacterium]
MDSDKVNNSVAITARQKEIFALVDQAIAGDSEAFDKLYHLKAREILFHTAQLLNSQADVEDVAQDVVLLMYQNIGKLKSSFAFNSWMYQIIRNVSFNHNRKHRHATKNEHEEAFDVIEETNRDYLPETSVAHKDRNNLIFKAIMNLPLKQRESIVMYYYDELSYKEIAAAMKISINTVSTNILKGKKTLKKILEKYSDTENYTGKNEDFLLGIAAAPAISEALDSGIHKMVSDEMVNHFTKGCSKKLTSGTLSNIPGKHLASTVVSTKLVMISVVLVAIIGGGITYFNLMDLNSSTVVPQETPTATSEDSKPLYEPEVQILGSNGKEATYKNPDMLKVKIIDDIGHIVKSSLYDESGAEIYSVTVMAGANGDISKHTIKNLSPGDYEAVWIASTDDNRTAKIRCKFVIQ